MFASGGLCPLMLFPFARGQLSWPRLFWKLYTWQWLPLHPSSTSGHLPFGPQTIASTGMGLFLGHLLFFLCLSAGAGPRREISMASIFMPSSHPLCQASSVGPLCIFECSSCSVFCTAEPAPSGYSCSLCLSLNPILTLPAAVFACFAPPRQKEHNTD